jgi:NadR type nicotinamide-nucleotide adenylyltransferase
MEKRSEKRVNQLMRVVITGPECTGKSTLANQLAQLYKTICIPEYAREYVSNLGRQYDYNDLVHIAKMQLHQAHDLVNLGNGLLFLDTYLIITKIWFKVVYGNYPDWIDNELSNNNINLYLLCNTDIPWTPDPVRENGGEMREQLFLMYKDELKRLGCRYVIISGIGEQRLYGATKAVNEILKAQGLQELIKP